MIASEEDPNAAVPRSGGRHAVPPLRRARVPRRANLKGFADASPDVVEAVLREGGKLADEVLAPLNQVGDREGCKHHPDGHVTTPTGFKSAYDAYAGGG